MVKTYSSKFFLQIEIFKFSFYRKSWLQVKGDKFKEQNAKNLHFSMRHLLNTNRQNSHRITWREKNLICLMSPLKDLFQNSTPPPLLQKCFLSPPTAIMFLHWKSFTESGGYLLMALSGLCTDCCRITWRI